MIRNFIVKVIRDVLYQLLIKPILPSILIGLGWTIAVLLKVLPSYFQSFLHEHPVYGYLSFGFIPSLVFLAWKIFPRVIKPFKIYRHTGIFDYRPNRNPKEKTKNEEFLLNKVRYARNIKILGATGYHTFARKDPLGIAVLRDILENINGEIKILLLNPDMPQTEMRALALGESLQKYRQDIENSIQFLKELYDKGKSVELKLYKQRPIWKMIIADDNFLWLQYYDPKKHVEDTPVYGVKRNPNKENLFESLSAVFTKKWEHDGNPTYNFKTGKFK